MNAINTFFITTYGCQMNELDSEVMRGMLLKRGLKASLDEQSADLLIYNTCSVRDLAERKVLGKIGQVVKARKNRPLIGITGCMANAKKGELLKKLPYIDFVLGTNNIHNLNFILDDILSSHIRLEYVDKKFEHELDYSLADRKDPLKASVSIIRGCNKHCTYCVVPSTRGPEVSRAPESIVSECLQLIEKGYKEITLLGQNVNSYGKDRPEWNVLFPDLLQKLDAIAGKCRLRFLTSHPVDISPLLMEAIATLPGVCEFVHFPLQAGSNRVLHKMHRMYTKEEYFEKVAQLKEKVPEVSLGTDIIVGFPTETEEEFEETLSCMKALQYSTAFMFAYSQRKDTPASRWIDDVPQKVKEERLQRLIEIQTDIQNKLMHTMIGKTVEVLVEGISSKDEKYVKGTTRGWKNIVFQGDKSLIGTLQQVIVESYSNQTGIGKIQTLY
jgi:tRNA-2-methylthio-N6-dimethylallyladenosine synthase